MAWNALAALLLASLYAPLFHVHAGAGEAPLLHAHLPELEDLQDESVVHMESAHSHAGARSIDLLITTAAHTVQLDAVLVSLHFDQNSVQPRCGFVPAAVTRAHDPPAVCSLIPRAPPA